MVNPKIGVSGTKSILMILLDQYILVSSDVLYVTTPVHTRRGRGNEEEGRKGDGRGRRKRKRRRDVPGRHLCAVTV